MVLAPAEDAEEEVLLPAEMEELPEEDAFEEFADDVAEEASPDFPEQAAMKRVNSRQQKNAAAARRVKHFFIFFITDDNRLSKFKNYIYTLFYHKFTVISEDDFF